MAAVRGFQDLDSSTPLYPPSFRTPERQSRPRNPRRSLLVRAAIAGGVVAAFVLLAAPFVAGAYLDARRGEREMDTALALGAEADVEAVRAHLQAAHDHFAASSRKLSSPLVVPVRLIPGLSRQVASANGLSRAGALSALAGLEASRALDERPGDGWVADGRVDVEAVRRASAVFTRARGLAEGAAHALERSPRGLLVPPLHRARAKADDAVGSALEGVKGTSSFLEAAPALLGADGPRRYLVMYANLSELRGTGGFWGFHAFLNASNGELRLGGQGRPREDLPPLRNAAWHAPEWYQQAWDRHGALDLWENANLSADFPTVAKLAAKATESDGVIQIDPLGIAALLRLTGPVSLQTWPVPVTADNVSNIAHHEIYRRFDDLARRDAFGQELVVAVFQKLLSTRLDITPSALGAVNEAADGGHIQMYADEPGLQSVMVALGIDGGLSRTHGATDVLGIYNINADASKQDYFLRQEISYKVHLDPDTNAAHTELDLTLRDELPDGVPAYVTGPGIRGAASEDNTTMLLLTRPKGAQLQGVSVNGSPLQVSQDEEAGLSSNAGHFVIPSRGTVQSKAAYVVPEAMEGRGPTRTYRLHILRQPSVMNHRYQVELDLPAGWTAKTKRFEGALDEDVAIEIALSQNRLGWLGSQLLRPFRAIAGAF